MTPLEFHILYGLFSQFEQLGTSLRHVTDYDEYNKTAEQLNDAREAFIEFMNSLIKE
ncbi:hypothetical protein KNT81_gp047 [Proteus phage phiP4-3]|uniref:Uncharacterized protein n=1 Tax=Proteus phage phiP4-3 TaxID=2065203 RepID=A0A2I6PF95_9CAUD|nr:hypothetical protein KNT81_gp047 [Proteus phage phiP4-3]AUM58405.1 hypothetical protein phiP43_047 [Proteus phage phiP4-3]AZV01347.1 hypothetical protein vBSdyM006_210 [Shigella phage vB_SdyM_006]QQV89506.1 hypothetical protein SJ_88 [Proteus phage SJ_PmiM]